MHAHRHTYLLTYVVTFICYYYRACVCVCQYNFPFSNYIFAHFKRRILRRQAYIFTYIVYICIYINTRWQRSVAALKFRRIALYRLYEHNLWYPQSTKFSFWFQRSVYKAKKNRWNYPVYVCICIYIWLCVYDQLLECTQINYFSNWMFARTHICKYVYLLWYIRIYFFIYKYKYVHTRM